MLADLRKQGLVLHLTAIATVALIAIAGYLLLPRIPVDPPYKGLYLHFIGDKKGVNAELVTTNLIEMSSALSSGKTLVILGSSELQEPLLFVPYRFLPKILNVPVLAYGWSFFQSLGDYGMLAANADSLSPKTKLVVMLSPSWFEEGYMPTQWFLSNFQPQVLLGLYHTPGAREVFEQYLQLHGNEFNSSSPILDGFSGKTGLYMDEMTMEERIFSIKTRMHMLYSEADFGSTRKPIPAPALPLASDWMEYEANAERAPNPGHRYGASPETAQYLQALPRENLDDNAEFKALELTVGLLKARNVQALFVLQPLNPADYKDAGNMHILGMKIGTLLDAAGMQYYDMSDLSLYKPGTLRDSMHLGELGWEQVDQRIMQYYGAHP
jgi:D-alanine transfer protein